MMKYRVNLYTEAFRPRQVFIGRTAFGLSLGFFVLLLLAGGLWLQRGNRILADQQSELSTTKTELEAKMMALSKKLDTRGSNPAVLQAIAEQSRAVKGKRQLIHHLGGSRLLADTRFSGFMQGLSNSHLQGLWLTRVRADGTHLSLQGRSLSEELIPKWIHQLSTQADFRGKKFGSLEVSRPQDSTTPHLDFHLSTELQRGEDENG